MKKLISVLLIVCLIMSFSILVFAEEKDIKNGDIINFGVYPQTLVSDTKLIQKLDKTPKMWKSYNYSYSHTEFVDGSFQVIHRETSDNMQYSDFSFEGNSYRAVNFIRPRSIYSSMHWPNTELYPDMKTFNEVYYFKYEPISWIVVDAENKIVVSQKALDQQLFNDVVYYNTENKMYYADKNMNSYANDYTVSTLRKWLNNDFVSIAFTDEQIEIVTAQEYKLDKYFFVTEEYLSLNKSVTDKISIPSSSEFRAYNNAPITSTDYAAIQGYSSKGLSTRTVFDTLVDDGGSFEVIGVDTLDGPSIFNVSSVCQIVPVMKLSSLENNTDIKLIENAEKCGCLCHKMQHPDNFFVETINKIIKTLWTWFSIKNYCDCGLRHY